LLPVLQVKASSVCPEQTVEITEQVLERQRENMKAILQAYRFTGKIFSDLIPSSSVSLES
jgi:hypothetical protein